MYREAENKTPSKGEFVFDVAGDTVKLSGNFDSGNLLTAKLLHTPQGPQVPTPLI